MVDTRDRRSFDRIYGISTGVPHFSVKGKWGIIYNKIVINREAKLESIEEINCLQELGDSYIIAP